MNNICHIPVSIGELFDKYTILQIKEQKIIDKHKLDLVKKEINYLSPFIDKYNIDINLIKELKTINEQLWDIEDKIRNKEKHKVFDKEFIQLARNVYITNDKRSDVKYKINQLYSSDIIEVKSYEKYNIDTVEKKEINKNINKPSQIENLKKINELYNDIEEELYNDKYDNAIEKYKIILSLIPRKNINDRIKYLRDLGNIYEKISSFKNAIDCYENIITIEKNDISTIGVLTNQIGVCYNNLHDYEQAIKYFKKVLQINNKIPEVYNNIGLCYVNLKNYKLAEINFQISYKLCEKNDLTIENLANLYYYIKEYDKSIEHYNKLNTQKPTLNYASSFPHLAKKDFKTGFKLYENRLINNDINPQTKLKERVDIPTLDYWDGETKCNRLLIVAEQGLGDNIQYYRFIIELGKKYPEMKISYFCKKEISHIFNTYENIDIIDNVIILNFDYKVYIMSLPKILSLEIINPNEINYIKTDKDKLDYWKERMNTDMISMKNAKLKVGIVFNGLLSSFIEKSIPLKNFEILTKLNIALFIVHKKNDIEKDLQSIQFSDKVICYDIDNITPFEDTIHIIQNLDLLITIDTYIVHLAGILNVKTWLLLGYSEWRWSFDETKTYWYNSVELIRTKKDQPFYDLINDVKEKLKLLC